MMKSILLASILSFPSGFVSSKTLTEYPWGLQLKELTSKEKVGEFQNDYLESNLKKWVKKDEFKNFSLYFNGDDSVEIAGSQYRKAYGFYKNQLFYTIHLTEELEIPYGWKWENDSTFQQVYGKKADEYMIIMKGRIGGTIFNEGGYSATSKTPSHLIEFQTCVGTISKPTHLQYVIFEFDKKRLKDFKGVDGFYKFSEAASKVIPDQFPFSRIITKEDLKSIE